MMIDMKILYIILVTLVYLFLMFRSARDNSSGYGSGVGILLEWFLWTILYLVFWIVWLIAYW